jgi:isoquinoline 1-oxidoreductase
MKSESSVIFLESGDEQIIEPVDYDFGLSRRTFVQVVGGALVFAVAAPTLLAQERRRGGGGGRGGAPIPIEARLKIAPDGSITVMTGKVECGQGARAEITQAAAEELKVPVERVQLVMADTAKCPDDGITAGSRTTPSTLPSVRQACAAAREMRESSGAKDYAELVNSTSPSGVVASATTSADKWTILGKDIARPNQRDLVTGKHQFPSDIVRPGMLYGKILRPASYGATLKSIDVADAKAMDGVVVVQDAPLVGVAAPSTWLAKKALAALEKSAQWDRPAHPSSAQLSEHLRKNAEGHANPFADEMKSAKKSHQATYTIAYVQHTPMEPRVAVAEWEGEKLTVWTGSQNPFGVRQELAGAFHIPEQNVRVIVPDFGGGFGGKHTGETAVEAARLAKSAGKPVALHWTREEEFTWATFRPAAVIDAAAALDDKGDITAWHFVNINAGGSGVESPYRVGKQNAKSINSAAALRHGSYRALASTGNHFARESFMDELAAIVGQDPLDFRLAHIDDERLRAVLEEAAKHFKWRERRKEKSNGSVGIGLSCGEEKGSWVAACAEIEIKDNAIHIRHVCQSFDCGAITNPSNLKAQIEGSICMAIGPLLREAMEFEDGKIKNASLWKYQVPRFADTPKIDVHLINRPDVSPAGAGETPLIALAPAVANAVFHATGQRLRGMPLKLQSEKNS